MKRWGRFMLNATGKVATPPQSRINANRIPQVNFRLLARESFINSKGDFVLHDNYITALVFGASGAEFYRVVRVHDNIAAWGELRYYSFEIEPGGKRRAVHYLVIENWVLTGVREEERNYDQLAQRPQMLPVSQWKALREDVSTPMVLAENARKPYQEAVPVPPQPYPWKPQEPVPLDLTQGRIQDLGYGARNDPASQDQPDRDGEVSALVEPLLGDSAGGVLPDAADDPRCERRPVQLGADEQPNVGGSSAASDGEGG